MTRRDRSPEKGPIQSRGHTTSDISPAVTDSPRSRRFRDAPKPVCAAAATPTPPYISSAAPAALGFLPPLDPNGSTPPLIPPFLRLAASDRTPQFRRSSWEVSWERFGRRIEGWSFPAVPCRNREYFVATLRPMVRMR